MITKLIGSRRLIPYRTRYKWNIHQPVVNLLSQIKKWGRNAKTRRQLANLDPNLYRDIGLTDQQIHNEVKKKFWQ